MTTLQRQASVLLVMVSMMTGCFEEDPPILDDLFHSSDPGEPNGDCDPYLGGCPGTEILDAGVPMDGAIDAGSIDAECEDSNAGEPPPCDPYSGECAPDDPPAPAEPIEDEPPCDPYTGECEAPDEGSDEGPDAEEPSDPECDPYIEVCGPPPT